MTLDLTRGVAQPVRPAPAERLDAWPLLARLAHPRDLAGLTHHQLAMLAGEIRGFLVDRVCATGGHLGVNLGVVELTIALHRVFDSPRDVLLFDTGHQAYVHKILTGRAAGFDSLRQAGGLSGYPSRAESPHDWIESSHAATALSYADGFAKAFDLRGEHDRRVVAIVGDGALTGGLAWEGLNNLADPTAAGRPVIVVLNDNGRSYDLTVGGLAHHLGTTRGRDRKPGTPTSQPPTADPDFDKTVFEQLGLAYVGPVDGHDILALETALTRAARLGRPVLVHCVTTKGKGYAQAEADPADRMHGIGVLDAATGRPARVSKPSWTSVFGAEMTRIGADHPEVVAITAAMRLPVGLKEFAATYPGRVFDVGIAEQHDVCSAAGLAMAGLHPVVCVYATFLNRAFDQLLMDVALHRLPVTFVLDRAGITGPDGASHHGMWDTGILTLAPGLRVAAPRDPATLRELLTEAVASDRPTAIRFPKANAGPDIPAVTRMDGMDLLHRSRSLSLHVLLISAGVMAQPCLHAANTLEQHGYGVTVVDPRWITPVNPTLTHLAARHQLAVTVEDHTRTGGMGAATRAACADAAVTTPIHTLALPSAFLDHADRTTLLTSAGLDGEGITRAVLDITSGQPS